MNSTKEMITKKPADFYNRSNGNRIECELRGVGTCSVVKTVYKVRRSSWLNQASSLVIRLILISLAGVRLQSKQDSHCESCFVFGLTPVWSFEGVRLWLTPVQRYSYYQISARRMRKQLQKNAPCPGCAVISFNMPMQLASRWRLTRTYLLMHA